MSRGILSRLDPDWVFEKEKTFPKFQIKGIVFYSMIPLSCDNLLRSFAFIDLWIDLNGQISAIVGCCRIDTIEGEHGLYGALMAL